jgi:hypothetical protein
VAEEQVTVVFVEWVDAVLGEQAGPREGHQPLELGAFVV